MADENEDRTASRTANRGPVDVWRLRVQVGTLAVVSMFVGALISEVRVNRRDLEHYDKELAQRPTAEAIATALAKNETALAGVVNPLAVELARVQASIESQAKAIDALTARMDRFESENDK